MGGIFCFLFSRYMWFLRWRVCCIVGLEFCVDMFVTFDVWFWFVYVEFVLVDCMFVWVFMR